MIGLEELRKGNVRVRRLLRIVGGEAIVAQPEVQREAAFNRPSILKEEAGIPKVVLLRRRSVISHNLERLRKDWLGRRVAVEDRVDPLIYIVDVRVVVLSPFEAKLEIVAAMPIRLCTRSR